MKMPTYEVIIMAKITKHIQVSAATQEDAEFDAHDMFNPNNDGTYEHYDQECLGSELIK